MEIDWAILNNLWFLTFILKYYLWKNFILKFYSWKKLTYKAKT